MPEYINFSGAVRMTCVSTMIPCASFAGTDVRLPCTKSDALALEKPSLELEVGTLINGRFLRKAAYFPASITFPPPTDTTAFALFGMSKARVMISSISTVSSSLYSSTVISASESDFIIASPNISMRPFPIKMTTLVSSSLFKYSPILFNVPFPTLRIDGMDIAFPVCIFILLFLFNMPDYHCFASKIVAL